MKNSNDTIGNRTRNLPTCSAVLCDLYRALLKDSLNAHSWGFILVVFITKPHEHTAGITHASVYHIKHAVNGPIMMNPMQMAYFHEVATAKYQFYCCMLTACCILGYGIT